MDWNPLGAWNGMRIDEAVARRNPPRPYRPKRPLTEAGRGLKEAGSCDPVGRAQVAELVDALASGASGLTAVKVRVLSWAPSAGRVTGPPLRGPTPLYSAESRMTGRSA